MGFPLLIRTWNKVNFKGFSIKQEIEQIVEEQRKSISLWSNII